MAKTSVLTLVVLVLIAAVIVYSTVGLGAHTCEVCIAFDGRQACRTVEASTEEEARSGATTNACALLSAGVTDTLRCQRTPPVRVQCSGPG